MNRTIAIALTFGLTTAFSTTASAQHLGSPCGASGCPLQNDTYAQSSPYGFGSRHSANNRVSEYRAGFGTGGYCADGSCSSAAFDSSFGDTSSCGTNGCSHTNSANSYDRQLPLTPNATYERQRGYGTNDYSNTFNAPRNRSNSGHFPGDGHDHGAEHYEGDGHNHGGHFPGDGHNHAGEHYLGDGHNHATPSTNNWNYRSSPNSSPSQQTRQTTPLSQGPPPIGTLSQPSITNRRPVDSGNFF